jgi:hypothetical protein
VCFAISDLRARVLMLGWVGQFSSSTPAEDGGKREECLRAGAAVRHLLEKDIKPRDIMTRAAFENAMVGWRGRPDPSSLEPRADHSMHACGRSLLRYGRVCLQSQYGTGSEVMKPQVGTLIDD